MTEGLEYHAIDLEEKHNQCATCGQQPRPKKSAVAPLPAYALINAHELNGLIRSLHDQNERVRCCTICTVAVVGFALIVFTVGVAVVALYSYVVWSAK
jgi:hypothetical protein